MKNLFSTGKIKRVDSRGKSQILLVVAAVLVLVIVVLAVAFSALHQRSDTSEKAVNKNEFQALFLTNGQVYFGKLSNVGKKYVTLTDIYYLQVQTDSSNQNLQQASGSTSNSKVSLAKLGSELHGPEDKMEVSAQQVLFWENLKSNSKVVQAIDKYQNR